MGRVKELSLKYFLIQLDIYVYDNENENIESMIAVHKNTLDL